MSYLGVAASATGQRWVGASRAVESRANELIQISGLDPIIAAIAARLGATPATLDRFVDPKLRDWLPDPSVFVDADHAAMRINQAIDSRERVAIFGDYDVDGATSSTLILEYLRFFGLDPTVYIPDRLSEGYGPNTPAMQALANDHSLIITVDTGILAHEPIDAAVAIGADVIVLDHHLGGETNPDAICVNPNRQDVAQNYGYFAAAAVCFMVLGAVNQLRTGDKPNLLHALDLVALATVADVAPLVDANRAFVHAGLKIMGQRGRPGLTALIDRFLPNRTIEAQHIGFTLAPRLNAGGRVGRSSAATELLSAPDLETANRIIDEVDAENTKRRAIEGAIIDEAYAQAEAHGLDGNLIYAAGDGWHAGVIGIIASRLKSRFSKPALAIAIDGDVAHGSARSVEGVDLGGAISRLVDEGLLIKGGGHQMAAGLTVARDGIDAAMDRLDHLLARQFAAYKPQVHIDAAIGIGAVQLELLDNLEGYGPFGSQAAAPIFALADMRLASRHILKDTHIRYRFADLTGQTLEVISFGAKGQPIEITEDHLHKSVHIAVSLSRNHWNGRESVSVQLVDWAPA